jgi:pimeloyl-ACP methyl ester carboxylesterase
MSDFVDGYWLSADGLRLHYRDYAAGKDAGHLPIICLPGLTRNVRDFANLAQHLSAEHRVICIENRGRGDSAYSKDSPTYNPLQYVQDLLALCADQGIARFVAIGTSLGGLMTMLLAMINKDMLAGAVLNDIGPELDPEGLARIAEYLGQGRNFPTWMHAARALEETQGAIYPDFAVSDWLAQAKRVMTVGSNGRIVFDYDMKIAEPLQQAMKDAGGDGLAAAAAATPDMWPALAALGDMPLLFIRGELSDLLTEATLAKMRAAVPAAEAVTVPRVGHAPTLDEPICVAAIERLLVKVR